MSETESAKTVAIADALHVETISPDPELSSSKKEEGDVGQFDPTTEKHIRHKFDRRIMPLGIIIYLMSQIDRSNMGNATVLG